MSLANKWMHIQVTDLSTGKETSNVRIPLSLAKFGLKMAAKYAPESMEKLDVELLTEAIQSGDAGVFVDVEDSKKGERVLVSVK